MCSRAPTLDLRKITFSFSFLFFPTIFRAQISCIYWKKKKKFKFYDAKLYRKLFSFSLLWCQRHCTQKKRRKNTILFFHSVGICITYFILILLVIAVWRVAENIECCVVFHSILATFSHHLSPLFLFVTLMYTHIMLTKRWQQERNFWCTIADAV
jgi:hypothetical protein